MEESWAKQKARQRVIWMESWMEHQRVTERVGLMELERDKVRA